MGMTMIRAGARLAGVLVDLAVPSGCAATTRVGRSEFIAVYEVNVFSNRVAVWSSICAQIAGS
jgi:hypothetical protein